MKTFGEFKAEILKRAKAASACTEQYHRAYKSQDWPELFKVITENWSYAYNNGIVDPALIEDVKDEAAKSDVHVNVTVTSGFLLASGSATVEASGSATVNVRSTMDCKISDHAIMRHRDTNEIVIIKGQFTVKEIEP